MGYSVRKLETSEKAFSTTKREALGVIKPYLTGIPVKIVTDHSARKKYISVLKYQKGHIGRMVCYNIGQDLI